MISSKSTHTQRETLRQQIQREVQVYLQQGGGITVLPNWVERSLPESLLQQLWGKDGR